MTAETIPHKSRTGGWQNKLSWERKEGEKSLINSGSVLEGDNQSDKTLDGVILDILDTHHIKSYASCC